MSKNRESLTLLAPRLAEQSETEGPRPSVTSKLTPPTSNLGVNVLDSPWIVVPQCVYESVYRFFGTPHDAPPKYVFMMSEQVAYLDESPHSGPGYVVLAGFFGKADQWNAFIPDWKEGLGSRKALHMRKLRWNHRSSERRTKELLKRLGPIPYKHGLTPIHGAVRVSDYYDLVKGSPAAQRQMVGYTTCLFPIMLTMNELCSSHETVKIICEMQTEYEPLAIAAFKNYRQVLSDPAKPYFSGIEFIPKGSSMLTQPSDYLAFAIAKQLDESGSKRERWCRPILGSGKIHGLTLPRNQVRGMVSRAVIAVEEYWRPSSAVRV